MDEANMGSSAHQGPIEHSTETAQAQNEMEEEVKVE